MNLSQESAPKSPVSNETAAGIAPSSGAFKETGLYLLFPDRERIVLTREKIELFAHTFESNLEQIPDRIRNAVAFGPCPVCPEKCTAAYCHALPPTLAFIEELEGFKSYDKVDVIYRGYGQTLVWAPATSMQEALQFVAILSLMFYCEVGRKYRKFFMGTHPLQSLQEMTNRIHLNVFWDCEGDTQKPGELLARFAEEINCTCRCQVQRLRLICKSDALMGAFINALNQIELLALCKGALLEESFEDFLKNG
jgi:hypothetical protein